MATTSLNEMTSGSKPQNPVVKFSGVMDKFKSQLALAIPKHLNTDRFVRLVLTAFSSNADLQRCTDQSILASVMAAAQMGLEPGINGQGYLIPYKGTCTFVPGWRGIVDIVSRSGRAAVWTGTVFSGDFFEFAIGDKPFVRHVPAGEDDPKLITHVYAIGRVNGSEWPVVEVWPISKVRKHFEKNNKVGERHYANKHWEMYARKVPLLQVCKYMPQSVELQRAVEGSYKAETAEPYTLDGTGYVVDSETGEITGEGNQGSAPATVGTFAQYIDKLKATADVDVANIIIDEARNLPEEQYSEIVAFYKKKFIESGKT
jgi:recombination protein RecT